MAVEFSTLKSCDPASLGGVAAGWSSIAGKLGDAEGTADGVAGTMNGGAWRGQAADAAVNQTDRYNTQLGYGGTEAATIKGILNDARDLLTDAKSKLDDAVEEVNNNSFLSISDDGVVKVEPPDSFGSGSEEQMHYHLSEEAERLNLVIEQAVAEASLIDVKTAAALRGAADVSENDGSAFNGDAGDHALDREGLESLIDELYNVSDQERGELFGKPATQEELELWDSLTIRQKQDMGFYTLSSGLEAQMRGSHYDTGAHNNGLDAWRHSTWNAYMAQFVGSEFAEDFGNAHEMAPPSPVGGDGNPPDETLMDLHNNEVGRQIAAENPGASDLELRNLTREALENGELLVIDESGGDRTMRPSTADDWSG